MSDIFMSQFCATGPTKSTVPSSRRLFFYILHIVPASGVGVAIYGALGCMPALTSSSLLFFICIVTQAYNFVTVYCIWFL